MIIIKNLYTIYFLKAIRANLHYGSALIIYALRLKCCKT